MLTPSIAALLITSIAHAQPAPILEQRHDPGEQRAGVVFVPTGDGVEGDAPSGIAYTPDGATIIVSHRESNNLILWEAATLGFVAEIPVSGAANSVAVTPDGSTAVVSLFNEGAVSIVDLGLLAEIDVIPIGMCPGRAAVGPLGDVAVVGLAGDSALAVVDLASRTLLRTIADIGHDHRGYLSLVIPTETYWYPRILFADSDRIVNADKNADEAQIINVRTGAVTRIPISDRAQDLAVSADGSTAAIVHSSNERRITVLDLQAEVVSGVFDTPTRVRDAVALSADGTTAAVTGSDEDTLAGVCYVIDLDTGAPGPILPTGSAYRLVTTPDGGRAFGAGYDGAFMIDLFTGSLLWTDPDANPSEFVAMSPSGTEAAGCSAITGERLSVFGLDPPLEGMRQDTTSGPGPEADRARRVAMSEDGSVVAALSVGSDTISIIDPAGEVTTAVLPVGERPTDVEITPDNSKAVVSNLFSDCASIIDLPSMSVTNVPIAPLGTQVELCPSSQFAYVHAGGLDPRVWRINLQTGAVEGDALPTRPGGSFMWQYWEYSHMRVSPDGAWLVFAGSGGNFATIIDTKSWTVAADIPIGGFPTWVDFSPDSLDCYISSRDLRRVTVISLRDKTPMWSDLLTTLFDPWHVRYGGPGLLVTTLWNFGKSRILIADADELEPLRQITMGGGRCVALATARDSDVAYAVTSSFGGTSCGNAGGPSPGRGSIHVIHLGTLEIVETIELDTMPVAMDTDASVSRAALAAPFGDGVLLVDLPAPCSAADLAAPLGTLDFSDALEFLGAFAASRPGGDTAPPEGVFDYSDVIAFLAAFSEGCP